MTVSELISKLSRMDGKLEVLLSTDDSYYGNVEHALCDVLLENDHVVLGDVCNYGTVDAACPAKKEMS